MTAWPRAIVGGVRCMARPRRPEAEARAVREAAKIVRAETGLTSVLALGREIADRVAAELVSDLDADPLDHAFAAIERDLLNSPFQRLATCPTIDTATDFLTLRFEKMRARNGRYLSPEEQRRERDAILRHLSDKLARRYSKHLWRDQHLVYSWDK